MENLLATPVSIPSTKSSDRSSRSGHTPGTPKPPIDPPRRRSSLAFSQVVYPRLPCHSTPHQTAEPNSLSPPSNTPARNFSNVGKKRACTTPMTGKASPSSQNALIQRNFQEAQTSLQLDVAFASAQKGSIGSRLPPSDKPQKLLQARSNFGGTKDDNAVKSQDWRYSTAPGLLAKAHLDVREPFPEVLPLLPTNILNMSDDSKSPVAEPLSSGFNTPVGHHMNEDEDATENDPLILALPDTSPMSKFMIPDEEMCQRFSSSPVQRFPMLTELERPLTEMKMDFTNSQCVDQLDDSSVISHLHHQSGGVTPDTHTGTSPDRHIFLSTPAKAAAESARAKRGLLGNTLRSTGDKENINPYTLCPDPSVHAHRRSLNCPDPELHHCPDPRLHQFRMSTPIIFSPPGGHSTPSSNIPSYHPSPSPLRVSLHPPAPPFRRADSSGSPLPIIKVKSPPTSPDYHRQSHYSAVHDAYPRYILPPGRALHALDHAALASVADDHFHPGWSQQPAEQQICKPKASTYAFSTAASKVDGSSPAPDSRIRDSYRTDTLTPLSRPACRYKKHGTSAVASAMKGVGRFYANANYSPWPPISATRPHLSSRRSMATPDQPRFMSSPPKAATYGQTPMKRRPKGHSKYENFPIAEDETALSVPGTVTEEVEPMEIDEEIQAAVSMSIVRLPESSTDVKTMPKEVAGDVKDLSPHVSPFRKRKGMKTTPKPRSASYWDQDLPEVRKMDEMKKRVNSKRPATMEAGRKAVKSMRISGIKSSPARGINAESERSVDVDVDEQGENAVEGVDNVAKDERENSSMNIDGADDKEPPSKELGKKNECMKEVSASPEDKTMVEHERTEE